MLEKAHVTEDARLMKVSARPEQYDSWNKQGYSGEICVQMDPDVAAVAEEILRRRTQDITLGLRSSLAQLGIDAVMREGIRVRGRVLVMDALLVSMDQVRSEQVLEMLCTMTRQGLGPVIGRGVLLPQESRLQARDIEDAVALGQCSWDPRSIVREDGTIAIPPLPMEYRFGQEAYKPETLRKVLGGASGRAMLRQHRTTSSLPPLLAKGAFFVGGFALTLPGLIHAMLRRQTVDAEGHELLPMHSAAGFLEAVRTDAAFGDRQIEITNVNGKDVDLSSVHVVAALHHAAKGGAGGI